MEAKALTIRPAERKDLNAMVSLLQALFAIEMGWQPTRLVCLRKFDMTTVTN